MLTTRSELASVDKNFRLHTRLESFSDAIHRELKRVDIDDAERRTFVKLAYAAKQEAGRLVDPAFISHTPDPALVALSEANRKQWFNDNLPGYVPPSPAVLTPAEQAICDQMSANAAKCRKSESRFRVCQEIMYRADQGWFMIFDTLTVAQGSYKKVFNVKSTAFKEYIRAVKRKVAQDTYGSVRNAEGKEYHTYFAVVERGKLGRWHIHVVHFCKKLKISDPNKRLVHPTYREAKEFKPFWPYGISCPILIRYAGDAFTKNGFKWPVKKQGHSYVPIQMKNPIATGLYLSKYLDKAFGEGRKEYPWRIRRTRGLGLKIIDQAMKRLDLEAVALIVIADPTKLTFGQMSIPRRLIRVQALKVYLDAISPINRRFLAMGCERRPSPLQRYRDMSRKKQECNLQSIGSIKTEDSANMAEYDVSLVQHIRDVFYQVSKPYLKKNTRYRVGGPIADPYIERRLS
jgi:hypothetical protein